ncbi:MAG: hypothetical protein WC768_00585 [Patescibacteria group bacterium]|jgi:hypothetical protein
MLSTIQIGQNGKEIASDSDGTNEVPKITCDWKAAIRCLWQLLEILSDENVGWSFMAILPDEKTLVVQCGYLKFKVVAKDGSGREYLAEIFFAPQVESENRKMIQEQLRGQLEGCFVAEEVKLEAEPAEISA